MTADELRKMSKQDMQKELSELLREHFNLRVQRATSQLAKPHLIKKARRNVARVKTILNEKSKKGTNDG